MLLLLLFIFQITSNSWTNADLRPPPIGSQIVSDKLNRTGIYGVKIKEILKILDNSTAGSEEQKNRLKAYTASMSNVKVKQATQKIFDEMQNVQNFTWMVLNRTDEELSPVLGDIMIQVQEVIDRTCKDLKGNYTVCLPAAMRNVASQMISYVGRNKTKIAFDRLLEWESGQKAGIEQMRKFFA
uniref:Secreted protein n=1 Tax=Haemonchus contortus TaxID=6289 RepID=A0A7I4Y8L3_HAECO